MSDLAILAIDTATPHGGVAVWRQDRLLAAAPLVIAREHSQRLFGQIDHVLTVSDVQRQQIGAVAVTIGPGSFTGLRIGISAAKGLCCALDVQMVPVSTLEALAARLPYVSRPVACLLNARRGQIYAAVYDTSAGRPVCLQEPRATTIEELLVQWGGKDVLFTGDGVDAFDDEFPVTATVAPASLRRSDAAAVAWLAQGYLQQGCTVDIIDAEPEYLRTPVFATTAQQVAARGS